MRVLLSIKALCLAIMLLLCNADAMVAQTYTLDSTTLTADTVITGLNVPWELKWGADGYLWMTEREGKVSRVDPQIGTREIILDKSTANGGNVYQAGESGMLGFDFHPQFPDSSYLFVAYTYRINTTPFERLVRFEYDGDSLINELTLIDNIDANGYHNGSRVAIGPDGKLYMTTGDAVYPNLPQDLNSLNGKILRINIDGTIPTDNPIPGSPIWTWGHRNPQGLHFGPSGILYSSEHGPNTDDEINIIHPARNYGWPTVKGKCNATAEIAFCADSNVVESIYDWTPTIAPSDLLFYNHPSVPEWQGSLLLTVLKDKKVIRLTLNSPGDSITSETSYFVNQWGRIRDICVAPDGTVYLATNGASPNNTDPNTHSIIRLKNLGFVPPMIVSTGADQSICQGSNTQLNASATGGMAPLTYEWQPTTGLSCSNCLNPVASPTTSTTYVLTVTDAANNTAADTVNVNVVNQPGPLSYNVTIIDTFGIQPLLEFNINAPAADSVVVRTSLSGTPSLFLNSQNFTFTDSTGVACTIGDGDCWIDYYLWIYAYSDCGIDSLYDSERIIVKEWNSINELDNSFFTIYPNPTNGNITLTGLIVGDKVTVSDISGKKVIEFTSSSTIENITTLKNLPAGVYYIIVERDGLKSVQKLIKQ